LQLTGNGNALTIMGYGVNAAAFNANPATYSAPASGNTALGQSTSSTVPRVVAVINGNGGVDSSTALTNVFNENNPRSVWSPDGNTFYIAGQGASKTDTATQGVFVATKGASTATQLFGANDARFVTGNSNTLYFSQDYNPPNGGAGIANISSLTIPGGGLPTAASGTPTVTQILPPSGAEITVAAANENGVNDSRAGSLVYLSPESYFFASSTVLYVADSGTPKNGNAEKAALGDGGLQKWIWWTAAAPRPPA
jgi:hypothetical protein